MWLEPDSTITIRKRYRNYFATPYTFILHLSVPKVAVTGIEPVFEP